MKVAFLTGSISRAGAGVFEAARHWAAALCKTEREVVVALGLQDQYTHIDQPLWGGVQTLTASVVGPARYGFSPGYKKNLDTVRPRLVHLHGLWMYPSRLAVEWKRRSGYPLCVTPYGMLEPWALDYSRFKKLIMRALQENDLLRNVDCMHALSEEEAGSMRQLGFRKPIFIAPTGAPPPPVEVSKNQAGSAQPNEQKTLVFLGRIHEKKGIFDLIRAWGSVSVTQRANHRWRLLIAGWGTPGDVERLEQGLRLMPVCYRPEYVGPQFDLEKWSLLGKADAFILPSYSEGMPVAVLEAWAVGVPVLMTDACHLGEGFSRGASYRIESGIDGVSKGLKSLFDGDVPLETMSDKARCLASEKYDWDKIAHETADVYAWLRQEGDRPACIHLG